MYTNTSPRPQPSPSRLSPHVIYQSATLWMIEWRNSVPQLYDTLCSLHDISSSLKRYLLQCFTLTPWNVRRKLDCSVERDVCHVLSIYRMGHLSIHIIWRIYQRVSDQWLPNHCLKLLNTNIDKCQTCMYNYWTWHNIGNVSYLTENKYYFAS